MSKNAWEVLHSAPEMSDSFRRHRAALITICTPIILIWLYDISPYEMPIMSLAVVEADAFTFWKIMLTLVGWASLVLGLDLALLFMDRKKLLAKVNQGWAYDSELWIRADAYPPDEDQRPADDPSDYKKWGSRVDFWERLGDKISYFLGWATVVWFPTLVAVASLLICVSRVFPSLFHFIFVCA